MLCWRSVTCDVVAMGLAGVPAPHAIGQAAGATPNPPDTLTRASCVR